MAVQKVGYQVVLEGAKQAITDLNGLNKALTTTGKSGLDLSKLGGAASPLANLTSNAGKATSALSQLANVGIGQLTSKLGTISPALGSVSSSLVATSASASLLAPPILAAAAALAVYGAGVAAFVSLGMKGAALQPTIAAFGNIVGATNDATQVLGNLREQTRGTINDFELMRLTVSSLKGTTSEFKGVVAKDLGTIIDLTGRIAQASGDSAEVVREKFLLGLRRKSIKLLDDVGVSAIDAAKANDTYAKSIGTVASALTQEQKDAAFAAEAIRQLKNIGQEVGTPAATLENLQRPLVAFQNVMNKLALAVLPAFAPFAKVVADISAGFERMANFWLPLVAIGFETVGMFFTTAFANAQAILGPVFNEIYRIADIALPYLVAIAQIAQAGFEAAISAIASAVQGLVSAFTSIFPSLASITEGDMAFLAESLAKGGANIIGSFAAGLLKGGTYVLKAVTAIAEIVADFLEGFSPPKKGPLSKIDEGGYNVAKAWADGFYKGALPPIEQVAADVDAALGEIGKLSAKDVGLRIAALDTAIQPFTEQLDIAKGIFEEIAGYVDPALKAIDRQTEAALKAKDAAALQALDKQAEFLKGIQAQEQARVDDAQLQLALAKAQYAQELALLNVQKKRVGEAKDLASAGGGAGAAGPKEATAKAAKEGTGTAAETSGAAGGFTPGKAPDLFNVEGVAEAKAVIEKGFTQGLSDSGVNEAFANFQAQSGDFQNAVNRIKNATPGEKTAEKLAPITNAFDDITSSIGTAKSNLDTGLSAISTSFTTYFGENGTITTLLTTLTGEGGLFSATGGIGLAFTTLFGEGGTLPMMLDSFSSKLTTFITNFTFSIAAIPTALTDFFVTPFEAAKTSIYGVLEELLTTLGLFAASDLGLGALGASLVNSFVNPFIDAVNAVISTINSAINNVVNSANEILSKIGQSLPNVNIPTIPKAAKGGLGLKGLTLVGEQGPELVNFGKAANVFPASLSRSIMQTMSQPQPIVVQGGAGGNGGNTYDQSRSVSSTFNVNSPQQARLIERQRLAYSGF